jgi:hypothetical protein
MAFLSRIRMACAALAAGWGLLFAATAAAQPQPQPRMEANIKAVFLYNFAKYVTWPQFSVPERRPAEVRICVTASDGFFELLKTAVKGEDIDGKPLVAVALDGLDEARACQILYVGDAQGAEARDWLAAVHNAQVLTVGDGTLTDDTVITFVRDDNRIRFDINRAAASRYGLNVSSKLLRLARRIRDR